MPTTSVLAHLLLIVLHAALPHATSANVAIVWESDEFIASVRAALTTKWDLVLLTHAVDPATLANATAAVGEVPLALVEAMPALRLYQSMGYASPDTLGPGGTHPTLPRAVTVCGGCYLLLWALRCGPRFSAARQAILASELEAGRGGGLSRAAETELIGSLKSEVHVLKVSTSLS